jgi:hypothetical protein
MLSMKRRLIASCGRPAPVHVQTLPVVDLGRGDEEGQSAGRGARCRTGPTPLSLPTCARAGGSAGSGALPWRLPVWLDSWRATLVCVGVSRCTEPFCRARTRPCLISRFWARTYKTAQPSLRRRRRPVCSPTGAAGAGGACSKPD